MSHKIAKALRAFERGTLTHKQAHLLVEKRCAVLPAPKKAREAHSRSEKTRYKSKVRRAKELLERGERPLITFPFSSSSWGTFTFVGAKKS